MTDDSPILIVRNRTRSNTVWHGTAKLADWLSTDETLWAVASLLMERPNGWFRTLRQIELEARSGSSLYPPMPEPISAKYLADLFGVPIE